MSAVVCVGDVMSRVVDLRDGSFDGCFCDPPYGLSAQTKRDVEKTIAAWDSGQRYKHGKAGFVGLAWDAFVPGPEVWREVFRVLKPGARLAAFAGTRTMDLMTYAIGHAGFAFEGTAYYGFGSGFPKAISLAHLMKGKAPDAAWAGHKTAALKPAYEPLLVFRKPGDEVVPPAFKSVYAYGKKPSGAERNAGVSGVNTHPTLKSIATCRGLLGALFSPTRGSRLFVPFSGSGSEMIAALGLGYDEVVGIEQSPEFARIARERVAHWHPSHVVSSV